MGLLWGGGSLGVLGWDRGGGSHLHPVPRRAADRPVRARLPSDRCWSAGRPFRHSRPRDAGPGAALEPRGGPASHARGVLTFLRGAIAFGLGPRCGV